MSTTLLAADVSFMKLSLHLLLDHLEGVVVCLVPGLAHEEGGGELWIVVVRGQFS